MPDIRVRHGKAACLGLSSLIDNEEDSPEPTDIVRALCAMCPVYYQCLRLGLVLQPEFGIWGGLTRVQRAEISKDIRDTNTIDEELSVNCPGCSSEDYILDGKNCVCLDCGLEWSNF